MSEYLHSYVSFFNENWILLAILWVLLIILARTKMEMYWLDIILPGFAFAFWIVLILFFGY